MIKKLGFWEYAGFRKEGFLKGLLYGIPFLIIGIGSAIISNVGADFSSLEFISLSNVAIFTVNMFLVGMNEEIWMRSLILNIFLKKYGRSTKGIRTSSLLSAVVFGAIHIPNILFVEPITLIVQVVNAAAAGVLFGAIFVRTGNLWAVVLTHAMVDWISLFVQKCFDGGSSVLSISMTISQATIIILLGALPPLVIAWIYMNKMEKNNN